MFTDQENELLAILDDCAHLLQPSVCTHISDLAHAGEWGVALEELCNMLYEDDITIFRSMLNRIQALGLAMKMDESSWSMLNELVSNE